MPSHSGAASLARLRNRANVGSWAGSGYWTTVSYPVDRCERQDSGKAIGSGRTRSRPISDARRSRITPEIRLLRWVRPQPACTGCTQLRAHHKWLTTHEGEGPEPAFLALRVGQRGFTIGLSCLRHSDRPRIPAPATLRLHPAIRPRAIHARCRIRHNRPARRLSSSTD